MIHGVYLMIHQYWFRLWLGAIRHQAIAWTNNDDQDPWCNVVSPSHNGLKWTAYEPQVKWQSNDVWFKRNLLLQWKAITHILSNNFAYVSKT